jgi:hypothetical protein
MHTFILLSGKVQNWDRFMQGPKLTEGCHWRNAYGKVKSRALTQINELCLATMKKRFLPDNTSNPRPRKGPFTIPAPLPCSKPLD